MVELDTRNGAPTLSSAEYDAIRSLLYRTCGINLGSDKKELVKARVMRRLRALGVGSFREYLARVQRDSKEQAQMVDVLTTNKTAFFREMPHFEFMAGTILPELRKQGRRLRFWSAGCSTGEEPYSYAMLLNEQLRDLPQWDARILATDISARVLSAAHAGHYSNRSLHGIDAERRARFFSEAGDGVCVDPAVSNLVTFARLNLLERWPMKGPFHLISCRNVMIYFDRETRERLVQRFVEYLAPGGWLFIGHSESLGASPPGLINKCPSTYEKAR